MKLRKPCPEHERYDAHLLLNGRETTESGLRMYLLNRGDGGDISVCPGGVFLPDDTLIGHLVGSEWKANRRVWKLVMDGDVDATVGAEFALVPLDALSVREAPEVDKNQMGMW